MFDHRAVTRGKGIVVAGGWTWFFKIVKIVLFGLEFNDDVFGFSKAAK